MYWSKLFGTASLKPEQSFRFPLAPVKLSWMIWVNSDCIIPPQITSFTWPTWGPPGSCRPQIGPTLAPWTLLSGTTKRELCVYFLTCTLLMKKLSRDIADSLYMYILGTYLEELIFYLFIIAYVKESNRCRILICCDTFVILLIKCFLYITYLVKVCHARTTTLSKFVRHIHRWCVIHVMHCQH